MARHRVARRCCAAALIALVALGLRPAGPAAAHGGTGTLELVAAQPEPLAVLAVHYEVALRFAADSEPVGDVSVSAAAARSGQAPQPPVRMQAMAQPGHFETTVRFPEPGRWTVRFVSIDPAAILEQAEEVTGPATGAPGPAATAPATVPAAAQHDPILPGGSAARFTALGVAVMATAAIAVAARSAQRTRRRRRP